MACFLKLERRSNQYFPQNSTTLKVICSLPFIGIIPQIIVEKELARWAAANNYNRNELTDLINLKNNYKIGGLLRDCLNIALLIAGVAAGIFSASTLIGFSIITIGLAAYQIYNIGRNIEACRTLETSPNLFVSINIH